MSEETIQERFRRRRKMRDALTAPERERLEDEDHQRTVDHLRLRDWLATQPAGRLRKVPIGRPARSEITISQLQEAVDVMRRRGTKVTQAALATEVGFGRTTLTDWLTNQPAGTWAALQARGRRR